MKAEIEQELNASSNSTDLLQDLKRLNYLALGWPGVAATRGNARTTAEPLVDISALEFAIRALTHADARVRREAAFLIGQIGGGGRHIRCLKDVISEPTNASDVKVAVCEALATIGGPEAVKVLKQHLAPGNLPEVVEACLLGLHAIASTPWPQVLGPTAADSQQIRSAIDSIQWQDHSGDIQLLAQALRERLG